MAVTQPGAPQSPFAPPTSAGRAAPLSQFSPTGPVQGISQLDARNGGAYVQSVDPNSLTSYQLEQMSRSDSPLMQQAALRAQANAAARGGGVSGTQAIQASQQGMFDILAPIAGADAGRYGQVGDLNTQVLNSNRETQMNNQTAMSTSAMAAGASRYGTDERRHEFDTTQGNRAQDREWQLADQNTQARAQMRSQAYQTMLQTVFSDPSYWRDPQGAMGLMQTYSTNIDDMMQQLFPEYFSTDQNGNQVTT